MLMIICDLNIYVVGMVKNNALCNSCERGGRVRLTVLLRIIRLHCQRKMDVSWSPWREAWQPCKRGWEPGSFEKTFNKGVDGIWEDRIGKWTLCVDPWMKIDIIAVETRPAILRSNCHEKWTPHYQKDPTASTQNHSTTTNGWTYNAGEGHPIYTYYAMHCCTQI